MLTYVIRQFVRRHRNLFYFVPFWVAIALLAQATCFGFGRLFGNGVSAGYMLACLGLGIVILISLNAFDRCVGEGKVEPIPSDWRRYRAFERATGAAKEEAAAQLIRESRWPDIMRFASPDLVDLGTPAVQPLLDRLVAEFQSGGENWCDVRILLDRIEPNWVARNISFLRDHLVLPGVNSLERADQERVQELDPRIRELEQLAAQVSSVLDFCGPHLDARILSRLATLPDLTVTGHDRWTVTEIVRGQAYSRVHDMFMDEEVQVHHEGVISRQVSCWHIRASAERYLGPARAE